jgi:adenine-specific DNA-methyltransferase
VAGVRLTWEGKRSDVRGLALPLQVVEEIGLARSAIGTFDEVPIEDDGWRNQLIWGDNVHVLASLANELAGKVDLIYIDPPFDSRQDYKVKIQVGDLSADQSLAKIQSVIEDKAYRDTWGAGVESYLQMLYTRLLLLRELLSDRGSIFLHLAPNVSHLARVLLDEVFGSDNFRSEIIWKRTTAHADTKDFGTVHDSILCFSKTSSFIWHPQFRPHDASYISSHYTQVDADGRRYRLDNITSPNPRPNLTYEWKGRQPPAYGWRYSRERMAELDAEGRIHYPDNPSSRPSLKRFLDESEGQPIGDLWDDIFAVNPQAGERLGYDTQKPESLVRRIVDSSSDPDSLVLDCFVGSGTTAAVAEQTGRRWVAIDMGRFAIHTTRKRLLNLPGVRPFVVANLGQYERQAWQRATTGPEVNAYLDFIVNLYGATPVEGFAHVHGTAGSVAVHVGAVDLPVTFDEIQLALEEAHAAGFTGVDVLGWEWEMGLHDLIQDEAKERSLTLRLRRIPREVMDERAVVSGEVLFHELAHLKAKAAIKKRHITVSLEDFVLPTPELVPELIRSKVRGWSDYIDYWAVDFAFDGGRFHNTYQAFRTRELPLLPLAAEHIYDGPGSYMVLVKVVDIFGADTTTALTVKVP